MTPGTNALDGCVGIREDLVKKRIKKMALRYNFWCRAIGASRFGQNGIGDFLLTRENIFASVEAKGLPPSGTRGKPTQKQIDTGHEIWDAGSIWMVIDDRNVLALPLLLQAEGFPCYAPYKPTKTGKPRQRKNNRN